MTLYRLGHPNEGLYRVHADNGEWSWIERNLEDWEVLRDWPELGDLLLA